MIRTLPLALLSGVPALVYQVIWTREVGLLAGSQIEGISVVLAAFFGGLALGSHVFGPRADRASSPLRLYAWLEAGAGGLAALSLLGLRWLARDGASLSPTTLLILGAGAIVPATVLLGGTLPALLRAAAPRDAGGSGDAGDADLPSEASRVAGMLVAANTGGSVLGVGLAAFAAPRIGLAASLWAAAAGSLLLGAVAVVLARRVPEATKPTRPSEGQGGAVSVPSWLLLAAALAGAITLGFEALAARAAALRLGSSLFAWAWVLGLVLVALALGNAAFARAASRSRNPLSTLGWLEAGAAGSIALSIFGLRASPISGASGLSAESLADLGFAVGLPVFLMGGAFPFFVRLAVDRSRGRTREGDDPPPLAAAFGTLTAANTAGGILGALALPLALLPSLGLEGSLVACVAMASVLAAGFLLAGSGSGAGSGASLGGGLTALAAGGAPIAMAMSLLGTPPPGASGVLFVHHGRQATAAVLRFPIRGGRDLYVDGDPEASTAGLARETEALLAAVPLTLHPGPKRFLEVGFGSGITLGTALRFAELEALHCVEISESVLRAAPFFEPDNGGVASGADPRVRIERGDGRAFLARAPRHDDVGYDVIVANTVQPWSVGATGLYSTEYFQRISNALGPGGLAAQWLPIHRIGARDLAAILRTFFGVFPEGAIYWSSGNILVVGSQERLPAWQPGDAQIERLRELGLGHYVELDRLKIAGPATARFVVGDGVHLSDDVPRLEAGAAFGRSRGDGAWEAADAETLLLEQLAAAGRSPQTAALRYWLESKTLRRRDKQAAADRLEGLAIEQGLFHARRDRASRLARRGQGELAAGRDGEARRRFAEALEVWPGERDALLGLAQLAQLSGEPAGAGEALERLLRAHPRDAEAWNRLAYYYNEVRDPEKARAALDEALLWDPWFPEALGNRGLLAVSAGDDATARAMLSRLAAISPYGERPETRALRSALDR